MSSHPLRHAVCLRHTHCEQDEALSKLGCGNAPVLRDISFEPSLTLGVDHRWLDPALGRPNGSTRLGNLLYGLSTTYDCSRLMRSVGIPEAAGNMYVTGFLNFSQAFRDDLLNDEFYGGMTVGYEW